MQCADVWQVRREYDRHDDRRHDDRSRYVSLPRVPPIGCGLDWASGWASSMLQISPP